MIFIESFMNRDNAELLTDKVVVITGGAGLIGRELSLAVARSGGVAIIADSDSGRASAVANEILDQFPARAQAAELDITSKSSILALIEKLHQQYGRIDAVVNNAYPRNKNYGRKFEDVQYDDFCENLSLHTGGYFLVAQQFSLYFKSQAQGSIINMASIYGIMPPRFEVYAGTNMTTPVEYAAIKSSIIHLTKYMARYFKGTGIRVNAISPGGIADGQPEAFINRYGDYCNEKGMLDPKDIAGTLIFLLSDMGRFINGQNIVVDDGFSL